MLRIGNVEFVIAYIWEEQMFKSKILRRLILFKQNSI